MSNSAEDGIIIWDLKLQTHQVITNSPNLKSPAFWMPLCMDVAMKGFVCGMGGGELHVFLPPLVRGLLSVIISLWSNHVPFRMHSMKFLILMIKKPRTVFSTISFIVINNNVSSLYHLNLPFIDNILKVVMVTLVMRLHLRYMLIEVLAVCSSELHPS